jgi:hypothetical protein
MVALSAALLLAHHNMLNQNVRKLAVAHCVLTRADGREED